MANQESMRNQEMFKANQGTLSDFSMLYKGGIMGACDIDFVYERNGQIVIGEDKQMFRGEMSIPVGQFLMLRTLNDSDVCNNVFFVAHEKTTPYRYYVCTFAHFASIYLRTNRVLPSGKTQKQYTITRESMAGPFTQDKMCSTVKELCSRID